MEKNYNNGWYGKAIIASVTFKLEHSHKISQPKNLLQLSHDLMVFVAKQMPQDEEANHWLNYAFDPDGESWDEMLGIINIYLPTSIVVDPANEQKFNELQKTYKELRADYYDLFRQIEDSGMSPSETRAKTKEIQENYDPVLRKVELALNSLRQFFIDPNVDFVSLRDAISRWCDDQELMGFQFELDFSDLQKSRSRDSLVLRMRVVANPSTEYAKLPSINLSNAKTGILMRLLNIRGNYFEGVIDARALLNALNQISDVDIGGAATRPTQTSEQNVQVQDMGQNEDSLKRTINELRDLCQFAIKNNFKNIVWN